MSAPRFLIRPCAEGDATILSNLVRELAVYEKLEHVARAVPDMTGEYPDCHGVNRPGTGAEHLNMFTNDFF